MNTAKIYFDRDDNECSIWQMVKREPEWAAARVQEGELAIEEVARLRSELEAVKRERLTVALSQCDVLESAPKHGSILVFADKDGNVIDIGQWERGEWSTVFGRWDDEKIALWCNAGI